MEQARQLRSDVDYDSIESMDVELVQQHIMALTQGAAVSTPIYNMKVRTCAPVRQCVCLRVYLSHTRSLARSRQLAHLSIDSLEAASPRAVFSRLSDARRQGTGKRWGRTCRCR